MTLKEIFDVFYTITEADITARDADGKLLHRWMFGENLYIGNSLQDDIDKGKVTVVDGSINTYGDARKNGWCDAWAVKMKAFPKELLEAPVTTMSASHAKWYSCESHLIRADVELSPLMVEVLTKGVTE